MAEIFAFYYFESFFSFFVLQVVFLLTFFLSSFASSQLAFCLVFGLLVEIMPGLISPFGGCQESSDRSSSELVFVGYHLSQVLLCRRITLHLLHDLQCPAGKVFSSSSAVFESLWMFLEELNLLYFILPCV